MSVAVLARMKAHLRALPSVHFLRTSLMLALLPLLLLFFKSRERNSGESIHICTTNVRT